MQNSDEVLQRAPMHFMKSEDYEKTIIYVSFVIYDRLVYLHMVTYNQN